MPTYSLPTAFASTPAQFRPTPPKIDTRRLHGAFLAVIKQDNCNTPHVQRLEAVDLFLKTRSWFARETNSYALHSIIHDALMNLEYTAHLLSVAEMILEWPHESTENSAMIAYTRDDRAGHANVQTKTSLGKYLRRHAPTAHDYTIRKIVESHTAKEGVYKVLTTLPAIDDAVINGPYSCMAHPTDYWGYDSVDASHPYAVYDPRYGWNMVVRLEGEQVMARALTFVDPDDKEAMPIYVRTYKWDGEGVHGGCDTMLESWLQDNGYERERGWPVGARLAKYHGRSGYVMPYIDGDLDTLSDCGDYLELHNKGDIKGDNTHGWSSDPKPESYCEICNAETDECDLTFTHDEQSVCEGCLSRRFTFALTRYGEYWVADEDVVRATDDQALYEYDVGYGELRDYVRISDEDYDYAHIDVTYTCVSDGECYLLDGGFVEVDGDYYHPDNAPEPKDTEETEEEVIEGLAYAQECIDLAIQATLVQTA